MQNAKCKMPTVTMRRPQVLFAFCVLHFALLVLLTGCGSKARAESLPDGPPLAVPVAPAHQIAIEQIAEAPPPEPEPTPEPEKPAPAAVTRKPARPEPRAETPPPTTPPAAAVAQPQSEAPTVRAAPAAGQATSGKVKALLSQAESDLAKRVDYQKLSPDGRAQYEQSKRFADEARQAMKERNFLLALTLAEKAANIAAELIR